MDTIKVKSLKLRIVLQFIVIIIPITLVLIYEAVSESQQAERLKISLDLTSLAQKAKDSYKTFIDGAVEAVDTGRISDKAQEALKTTQESLLTLRSRNPGGHQVQPILDQIEILTTVVRSDSSLNALLPQRTTANLVNQRLSNLLDAHTATQQAVIASVAAAAKRQAWVTLIVMIVTLASATYFIIVMIRGLTDPLNRAVTLAENIAAGDFKEGETVDTSKDLGGLLQSLDAMRHELTSVFSDLERNEARLANAQRIAQIGDWEMNVTSQTITRSEEACRILGRTHDQLPPLSIFPPDVVHPDDRPLVDRALHAALREGKPSNIDFSIVLPRGITRVVNSQTEVKNDASGKPIIIAGTIQDITTRKAAEDQIRHLALHDSLTGLSNRQLFKEKLDQAIVLAHRQGRSLAVMFVDLDRFKNVNDTLGHSAGDTLLKEIAGRIQNSLRESDTVSRVQELQDDVLARQGGDEFTILLTNLMRGDQAARVAQRILTAIEKPMAIDGSEVVVTASIGISIFPLDGQDSESLLKHADAAMYYAKEQGKHNYQFFLKSINDIASKKLALENGMRKALTEEQFFLCYQPQVDAVSGKIIGAEALIRWKHPDRGIVSPVEFIPLAEETGLIVPIGEWVLRTACAHAMEWHKAGFSEINVSVNVASANFQRSDLVKVITEALKESGLDPAHLDLEMTESTMIPGRDNIIPKLNQLKALGVKLSIDDFGTGYSSLSYLKSFPIDTLKIDRAFVSGIAPNSKDAALTMAIISIAKSLGLKVIAEGVETEDQMKFLCRHGCVYMQGFLYSRPIPYNEIIGLLQQRNALLVPTSA